MRENIIIFNAYPQISNQLLRLLFISQGKVLCIS